MLFALSRFPIFFLFLTVSSCAAQESRSPFEADRRAVEEAVLSRDLTGGLVLAASSLYTYRGHPELPELAKSLRRSYSSLPQEEALALLNFRKDEIAASPSGLGWIDVGLLAEACEKHDLAHQAFESALEDRECCRIPTSYLLAGTARARIGDVTGAVEAYDKAVSAASQDADSAYRIRHGRADDLYYLGEYDLAKAYLQGCHAAGNTPQERAWALAMQIIYADWYDGDEVAAAINLAKLDRLLASEVRAPTLEFQRLAYEHTLKIHNVVKRAIEGSDPARMILDSLAASASFYRSDVEAAEARIRPWVERYTLDDIAAMDHSIRSMALDALTTYYVIIRNWETTDAVVAFYRSILDHPVLGQVPKNVVDANCWIGYCHSHANRLQEALHHYDLGLTADERNTTWLAPLVEPHPSYIRNGIVRPEERKGYVANYRNVLRRISTQGGQVQ